MVSGAKPKKAAESKGELRHTKRCDAPVEAAMDVLTGLMNGPEGEAAIHRRILASGGSDQAFALIALGIDRFRNLNELLGYKAGDDALAEVARRLREWSRCAEICRLGGDEFCVVVDPVADMHDATRAAESLIRVFERPFRVAGREVFLTASAGFSVFPADGLDSVSLLRQASRAVTKTKRRGGNSVEGASEPPLLTPEQRFHLETALRRALEREELALRFQPEVNRDGSLAGCEVLLSWFHPELGKVEADTFIRLAEEIGVIGPIGTWVLWQACARSKLWLDAGLQLPRIAVNVSALQLSAPEFVGTVTGILESTGLNGSHLELELTESSLMRDIDDAVSKMNELKQMGISFAIDDFGVGYSPLTYLHRLPVDVVKIDRTFVAQIAKPSGSLPLVQTITVLAHRQGFQVVAEGVETAEEMDLVRAVHCDRMQGYFFGAPVFTEEFETILRTPEQFARKVYGNHHGGDWPSE
jgi:diguanylate cyclase (GGDEF)-like protein